MTLENELDNLKSLFESIEIDDERKEALAKRIDELEIKLRKNEKESIHRKESGGLVKKDSSGLKKYLPKTILVQSMVYFGLVPYIVSMGYLAWEKHVKSFIEKKSVVETIDQLSKSNVSTQNARKMLNDFLQGYSALLSIPEESFSEKPAQSARYREWYYNTLRDALEKPSRLDEMQIAYFSTTDQPHGRLVMTNGLGEILAENDLHNLQLKIPKMLRFSPTGNYLVFANSEELVLFNNKLEMFHDGRRPDDPSKKERLFGNFERTSVLWLSDGSGFYLPSFGVFSPSLEKIAEEPQPGTLEKRNSPFKLSLEDQSVFLDYGDIRVPITKTADQGRVLLADIAP